MKNLIKTVGAIGIMTSSFMSYGQNQKLEKYNEKNKQVYSDIVDFLKEKGEKDESRGGYFYSIKGPKEYELSVRVRDNKTVINKNTRNYKMSEGFLDVFHDGFKQGEDSYLRITEVNFKINRDGSYQVKEKKKKELTLFKVAKRYTKNLKKIMRKARYKNY